jgi:hypothetical protein
MKITATRGLVTLLVIVVALGWLVLQGGTSMHPIQAARTINAPVEVVFRTVADIRNYRQAVPQITKVEFLTAQQLGVSGRFRETRTVKGYDLTSCKFSEKCDVNSSKSYWFSE